MRRHVCFIVLMLTIFSYGFCHKSQKQAEQINAESLTEKWLACEASAEEDYQTKLEENLIELNKYKQEFDKKRYASEVLSGIDIYKDEPDYGVAILISNDYGISIIIFFE